MSDTDRAELIAEAKAALEEHRITKPGLVRAVIDALARADHELIEAQATIEAVKVLADQHWDWKAGLVLSRRLHYILASTDTTEAE